MINIALLGFGTVGSGVAEVLTENRELIKSRTGFDIHIKFSTSANFPIIRSATASFMTLILSLTILRCRSSQK